MGRHADWTLVQLSGRLAPGQGKAAGSSVWKGQWVALNQRGEVYLYGPWADCWRSVEHWVRFQPPNGAAEGENGHGWRGAVPGLEGAA